jgi:DNA-binding NtrC family response regulator
MSCANGKCILVVDDDAAMLRALGKVLSGEGATVSRASGTEEALGHLADRHGRFDLVITDLRLPGCGGKGLLDAITVAFPAVPVIVVTAFGNPETRALCLQQGAADFLEKPVDAKALLAAMEQVLSSREKAHLAGHDTEEA